MNNLSSYFRARFAFSSGATAAKTHRLVGRTTVVICVAGALFCAKPISGLDQNSDGMSDVWQQQYSIPSTDADLDYSGNGLTNTQKSLLGLDPRDPIARFHLDIVNDFSTNQLRLRLNTVYGKRYQIESSTDLRSWIALNSPITGIGQTAQITLPLPQPPIFFRASYAGDIDADGDGLTAWEENLLGTNDNNSDTDNDGMPDAWEYSHGLNPTLNDANNDFDGDGATNLQEYQAGTDPNDYYNNHAPNLIIVSGNRQLGFSGSFLPEPMIVEVDNGAGQALSNAPVTFALVAGAAQLATVDSPETLRRTIAVRASAEGRAQVILYATPGGAGLQVVTANAGGAANHLTFFQTTVDDSSTAPPEPPGTLTAKGISPGNNLLTWQDNSSSESGFWIERRGSEGIWIRIATVGANTVSYLDDRADTQVSYNYRVKAINRSGASSWSEEAISQPWSLPLYQIEDLGQAPARRINNRGEVGTAINDAGESVVTSGDTPVFASIWKDGEVVYNFGSIGGQYSTVAAINNQRQIAGYATYKTSNDNTYIIRDFIGYYLSDYDGWIPVGRVTYDNFDQILHLDGIISSGQDDPNSERITAWLHLQGTTAGNASQFALYDNTGHPIRVSYDPVGVGTFGYNAGDAFVASADGSPLRHLGVLTDTVSVSNQSRAIDLNDSGEVIGISGREGFFWNQGTMQSLGVCVPQAINNSRQIVAAHGSYPTYPILVQPQAVNDTITRWTIVSLPILAGYETVGGTAQGINEKGDIVGSCGDNYEGLNGSATLWVSGTAFDLNKLVPPNSGWSLSIAYDINENGWISGVGYKNNEIHTFRLRPSELMVDGNRDGQMSFDDPTIHDADQTTKDKPYRFWLNNDHDEERTVDSDDREQDDYDESPDFNNPGILCERDLEDWSRLWINFKGIAELIKSPGVTVELAWKPMNGETTWPVSDGDPGIKVMLHDSLAGAGALQSTYLTESSKASAQAHGLWAGVIKPVNKSGGYTLTNDFLQFVSEDTPYLYLLFEGWTAGKGQLVLTIKKDGQTIGEYPPVYLELKDVKEMYERFTVGDVADPDTSVLSSVDYQHWPANHPTMIPAPSGQPLVPSPDETNDYVLWVHGWNMSPFDKDSFGDTAFKRLFWQGYKGRFGTFRWPTFYFTGDVPPVHSYDGSEHRAWASSLGLLALLNQLNSGPFAGNIRMMAHSMGNVVASEALRRAQSGQVVQTYIASQAAMPAHCYDATAPVMAYGSGLGPTTPNVYAYYWQENATSQPHDWQAEGRPSYMHPNYMDGKAGRYFNYYNDTDWALNGFHWQLDQQTKPDSDYGYEYAGSGSSTGFWRDRGLGATWLTFPTDRHEVFAWAAESRSYALGSQWVEGVVTGSTGTNRDLKRPPISYDRQRKYHSGQFRGMNMERRHYWEQLLIDCGLKEAQ
jgi:hypothetical protein